ncbi:MAG: 4-hydroxy-tetrahydrodipicolinate synthase [Halobacteriales archaeon]|nr:4-hydroxy-tetrahydrodipicolinate synthase [Halobacteriales archaeon]
MTAHPFAGVYPAMTTPFHEDGRIDHDQLREEARRLADAGVDGLVPAGSTGEAATLTHDEHIEVVETVVAEVDVPVIAGAGSNSTREAVSLSERAEAAGADAVLHISPYYNKPEPAGMAEHYRRIADAVDIDVIVYNVPSRTGRNIEVDTAVELASIENVTGYKAASGDMGRISEVIERTREETFAVLSGDDGMTYPIVATGGTGVISVSANAFPEPHVELVHAALEGDFDRARDRHHELAPLFRAMFVETNPIPVKEAVHHLYGRSAYVRPPLTRLDESNLAELEALLDRYTHETAAA